MSSKLLYSRKSQLTERNLREIPGHLAVLDPKQILEQPFFESYFSNFIEGTQFTLDEAVRIVIEGEIPEELSAAGEHRILVPIISRNDYLNGLRRCSRDGDAELLVRVLNKLWQWSSAIDFSDLAVARVELDSTNALIDPADAERAGVHLNRT
jgi:hypothetical protein